MHLTYCISCQITLFLDLRGVLGIMRVLGYPINCAAAADDSIVCVVILAKTSHYTISILLVSCRR